MMRLAGLSLALSLLLLCGCATDSHSAKAPMMIHYTTGNIAAARNTAENMSAQCESQDRIVAALEAGYLAFLEGDFNASRNAFVYAEQQSNDMNARALVSATEVGRNLLSNLKNLTALEYRATCRDRIMIHIFKALSYLGKGMPEAYDTEIFPMHQAMLDIQQEYMKVFQKESNDIQNAMSGKAIGSNVNGMLSTTPDIDQMIPNTAVRNFLNPLALLMAGVARAEANDWQNAKVDFNNLYLAMPQSLLAGQLKREVLRSEGAAIPPAMAALPEPSFRFGKGTVMVVFANGLGAALEQRSINSALLHAAIPVPVLFPQFTVPTLHIAGQGISTSTEMLADMDGMALWQYRLGYREMLTRTAISTAIKEGASITATAVTYNVVRNNSRHRRDAELAAGLVMFGSEIWRRSQNIADTRSWETLPAQFQAALLPMPADRQLRLSTDNVTWAQADIPPSAASAIIYVHSTGSGSLRHIVFAK